MDKLGEQLAAEYLISKGYKIRERGFLYYRKEVDIIAEADGMIVFVQVSIQNGEKTLAESLEEFKREAVKAGAACYFHLNPYLRAEKRFDRIEVTFSDDSYTINHTKNAF